jgi:hypothetical protein
MVGSESAGRLAAIMLFGASAAQRLSRRADLF